METKNAQSECGTVEYYVPMLASFAEPGHEKWFLGLAIDLIGNALADGYSDADRVAHARNVLAAVKQVRTEQAAE